MSHGRSGDGKKQEHRNNLTEKNIRHVLGVFGLSVDSVLIMVFGGRGSSSSSAVFVKSTPTLFLAIEGTRWGQRREAGSQTLSSAFL